MDTMKSHGLQESAGAQEGNATWSGWNTKQEDDEADSKHT